MAYGALMEVRVNSKKLKLVSVGTVGLHRTNLSAAFNKAVDDDLLMKSPMPRLYLVKLG